MGFNTEYEELDEALYQQYEKTNQHIEDQQNPYLKIRLGGDFTVSTPRQEEKTSEILKSYFPERHFVPLPELLSTVNAHTGFLEEFQHWQQRYVKSRTPDKIIYAGIIGVLFPKPPFF